MDITLGDLSAVTLGVDAAAVDMSTATGASAALDVIDDAIGWVSGYRSDYGAAEMSRNQIMQQAGTAPRKGCRAPARGRYPADRGVRRPVPPRGPILWNSTFAREFAKARRRTVAPVFGLRALPTAFPVCRLHEDFTHTAVRAGCDRSPLGFPKRTGPREGLTPRLSDSR